MTRNKQNRRGASQPSPPNPQAELPAPPPSVPRPFRAAWLAALCAVLAIATFAAYWKLHSNGFILFDDDRYVTENEHVLKGLGRESVSWAFTTTEQANWHPLTWLSHMLDVQLFGLDAGGHHMTSLLFHTLNGVLLLLLLFRMTGALWRSAMVAALFALHPLHVESVAWIAERKDVLSTLFWLLTLGAWLVYLKSKKTVPYALTLVFFALGLMSKPMLVTLPFTLLLLDYWPLQRLTLPMRGRWDTVKGLIWEKAPLFVMSAVSCVITVIAQKKGGAVESLEQVTAVGRAANAAHAYASYLGKTVFPSSLAVFYPHPHTDLITASAVAAFLGLAGVTVLVARLWKSAPYLPFGWLWYVGTLVPVIGLVQVGDQAMADRYTYMPLIGIFIAVVWGVADITKGSRVLRPAAAAAALAVLGALFALTRVQTGYWSNDETLFSHALAVTPDNVVARNTLGLALFERGRTREAVANYLEALRIEPNFPEVHNNLGNALVAEGRFEEAVAHFNQALRAKPDALRAMNNLGLALVKLNRLPEALGYFEEAVRRDPDFADAQSNLGNALSGLGRMDEAVEHYRQALRLKPEFIKALNNLGLALGKMNRMSESIECLRKAVRISPTYADAQNNLGVALAKTGRNAEAIEHYRQALKVEPGFAQASDNLGLALWELKRFPEALEHFQQAAKANPDVAEAHYHLGIALARARRLGEAREQLQKALQISPDYQEARAALENVLKGLQAGR